MRRRGLAPLLLAPLLASLLLPAPIARAAAPVLVSRWDLLSRADAERLPDGAQIVSRGAHGETRSVLQTPLPGEVSFSIEEIPPAAVLDLGVAVQAAAIMVETPELAAPVRFRALFRAAGSDAEPRVLVDRHVDIASRPEDRRWFDERIDLSAIAGRSGTLTLRTDLDGHPERAQGTWPYWSAPRILAPAKEPAWSVLLVTIDCLRADHLGAYGYDRPTSPALDRLAAEGIRYERAHAAAPMTLPSIPQVLTSRLFPTKDDRLLTAPFAAAGVPSAAIVNNAWIPLWLGQGGHAKPPGTFDSIQSGSLDAKAIVDRALAWLERHRDDRTLLYLHFLDAHTPYEPPARTVRMFADPAYHGKVGDSFADVDGATQGRYGPADRAKIEALYDAAVRYIDDELGRLLEALARDGRLERTIVAVTADHGEEFWDHGRFFHGQSLYEELLHVPLIVRLPGRRRAGTVVRDPVSLLSLAPSLVAWAGLEPPASFQSAPFGEAGASGSGLIATATQPQFPTRFAIRQGRWKLIESVDEGRRELFDLGSDATERRDLSSERPDLAERLGQSLESARDVLRRRGFQVRVVGPREGSARVRIALESEPRSGTFLTVDRREPSGSPRVRVSPDARKVDFEAVASASPTGFRFDRLRDPRNISGRDPVRLVVEVDGRRAARSTVALGPKGGAPGSAVVDLRAASLRAAATPECEPPPSGARVCLWWLPGETVQPLPQIADPAVREKLRALGYLP